MLIVGGALYIALFAAAEQVGSNQMTGMKVPDLD